MNQDTYQDVIQTIRHLIDDGQLNEAQRLLDEELRMPYIPPEVEGILRQLDAYVKAQQSPAPRASVLTPSQIMAYLNGDEEHQLAAVVAFSALNLRAQLPLIREAFEVLSTRILKSLLVNVCIEQALTEEFTFTDQGITYTFIPAALTAPQDSEGYGAAKTILIDWLENDNPSLLMLAMQQLDHTVLLKLPETVDTDEALDLALEVLKPIYIQLADAAQWQQFLTEKGLAHPLSTH
jgi:hypothetical protein